MTDRRLTPVNGRVAALYLQGQVQADHFTAGFRSRITQAVVNLDRTPSGPRDRQLLYGADVTVYETRDGWCFVHAAADGYVGYVPSTAIGLAQIATHYVATPATHLYTAEDIKSPDLLALSFGSRITVTAERRKFWETPDGYIPKTHLWPLSKLFSDPVTVAQMHFGVPYLWGGNSIRGIDCSGLVQASLLACGTACPGDSDMQLDQVGQDIGPDVARERGDLYFWQGHVGLLVDPDTLIHANAHHMAVAYEPLRHAIIRIAAQGDGPVRARKRF